jgi:hypothetical protein
MAVENVHTAKALLAFAISLRRRRDETAGKGDCGRPSGLELAGRPGSLSELSRESLCNVTPAGERDLRLAAAGDALTRE